MRKEVKVVTEKIRIMLNKLNLNFDISVQDGSLIISFEEEPNPETIKKLEEIMFFSNEVVVSINNTFVHNGTKIMVSLENYPVFVQMYEQLKKFNASIFLVEITEKALTFAYSLQHKHDLNYDELEALQNIINPDIENHDSIRVSYLNGVSTLTANLSKVF